MPRLPEPADFPSDLVVTIIEPPNKQEASNILILLHGLGDDPRPFASLGESLKLPETACLAIRGPQELPFALGGFHWGDDVIFDQSTGGLDPDAGFDKARIQMDQIVDKVLIEACGWKRREIFLFGYLQGGMVGLDVAARLPTTSEDNEYGGAISLGGPLPHTSPSPHPKVKTPVLVLGGEKNSMGTSDEAQKRFENVFETVNVVRWRGRDGDGTMTNAEEARPVLEFFARRLRSKAGVPKDAVELS